MNPLIITLGSLAPPKLAAVQGALVRYSEVYNFLKDVQIKQREVKTTVAAQPMTLSEIIDGAKQRAQAAFEDSTWGIGIESGFMVVPESSLGYMECSVCAVYDGKEFFLGFSPAFECPPEIMKYILAGFDLSEATKRAGLTTHEYVGYGEGTIGILSKGVIRRQDYMQAAVEVALMNLLHRFTV